MGRRLCNTQSEMLHVLVLPQHVVTCDSCVYVYPVVYCNLTILQSFDSLTFSNKLHPLILVIYLCHRSVHLRRLHTSTLPPKNIPAHGGASVADRLQHREVGGCDFSFTALIFQYFHGSQITLREEFKTCLNYRCIL